MIIEKWGIRPSRGNSNETCGRSIRIRSFLGVRDFFASKAVAREGMEVEIGMKKMTVELIDLSFRPECGVFTGTAAISSATVVASPSSGREFDPRREEDQCTGGAFYSILGSSELPESGDLAGRSGRYDFAAPLTLMNIPTLPNYLLASRGHRSRLLAILKFS